MRIYALDYLRGLAAVGVMIYHYAIWYYGVFDAGSVFSRLGIYGVSIFFIISGLSLYHTYHQSLTPAVKEVKQFFGKRIFRIFPLLWLVTILSFILFKEMPSVTNTFLYFSGLWAFFKWDAYFANGVIWSVGNELVFYCFFPFILFAANKSKLLFYTIIITAVFLFLYFTFYLLTPEKPIINQVFYYYHPLNNIFYFIGGMAIAHFTPQHTVKNRLAKLSLTGGLLLLFFFPVSGNKVMLIIGYNRLIFSLAVFMISLGAYKIRLRIPKAIHSFLKKLGDISYSVYLLHFLVVNVVLFFTTRLNRVNIYPAKPVLFTIAVITTLLISYFTFAYFEKPFIRYAKKKYEI